MTHDKLDILGVKVSALTPALANALLDDYVRERKPVYICVAPVSTIVHCQEDPHYLRVVNEAAMVTPDGMPVVWLAQWLGYKNVRRTYGPTLMRQICSAGVAKGYRHFFYGATPEVNAHLVEELKRQCPGIQIAGWYAPPFCKTIHEEVTVIDQINQSQADILWVGLGAPKQDFWMAEHRARIHTPVMAGVGAAFDFLAGTKRQAPVWIQNTGLEWLFRLCCEPQRLWKRYLLGNVKFIFLVFKEIITGGLKPHSYDSKTA